MPNPFGPVDWSDPVADCAANGGLTGWWLPGDENPFWGGPLLYDLKGRNHGTLTGFTAGGGHWRGDAPGGFGAMALDGTNDYVDCGTIPGLSGATKASFCAAVYRASTGTLVCTGGSGGTSGSGGNRFSFAWDTAGSLYTAAEGASGLAFGQCAMAGTGWRHVTAVYDGTQSTNATRLKVWVDGVPQTLTFNLFGSGNIPSALGNPTPWTLGKDASNRFGGGSAGGTRLWVGTAIPDWQPPHEADQWRQGYPDLLNRVPTIRTFVPSSGSTASGAGSSSGTSTAAAVGASTAASAGSSAGVGAASAVGASLAAVSASSAGTATASAVGASSATAAGVSAGSATASATGTSAATCAGTSAGSATAAATGTSAATCAGTSAGTATASATGASSAESVGSAAGTSTASAFSSGGTSADGTSAGTSTASATGQSTTAAAAAASGSATASAVGASTVASSGNISGSASASATGASIWAALAQATGMATASATGASLAAAAGTAAGTSTASGVSPASDNDRSPISYYEVEFFHDAVREVSVQFDDFRVAECRHDCTYRYDYNWGN